MGSKPGKARRSYGTGSVSPAGGGKWDLRWCDGRDPFTGKLRRRSKRITASSYTEANQQLQKLMSTTGDTSQITLGDILDQALPLLRVDASTLDRYELALRHIPGTARAWVAARIRVPDARDLFDQLASRTGAQNVRKIHTATMACWRQARLEGWLETERNPFAGLPMPKVTTSAGVPLTDAEVAALLAYLAPTTRADGKVSRFPVQIAPTLARAAKAAVGDENLQERAWLRLSLATGARPGEIVNLRWSAVNAEGLEIEFTDDKHGGRRRPVLVDQGTIDTITAWQAGQAARARVSGFDLPGDPWLFSNHPGSSEPWTVNYVRRNVWQPMRDAVGISSERVPYDLRHTHNSWLNADHIDPATRGKRIGNSPEVNARIYTHGLADQAAVKSVTDRLDNPEFGRLLA